MPHDIVAWIVDSKNGTYGPFETAQAAGAYLMDFRLDIAGPAIIKPVIEPMKRPAPRDYATLFVENGIKPADWKA